jgi:hypothetical protein
MGHNIEQGAGGIDVLLKFKGFVASVPRLLKLIVCGLEAMHINTSSLQGNSSFPAALILYGKFCAATMLSGESQLQCILLYLSNGNHTEIPG